MKRNLIMHYFHSTLKGKFPTTLVGKRDALTFIFSQRSRNIGQGNKRLSILALRWRATKRFSTNFYSYALMKFEGTRGNWALHNFRTRWNRVTVFIRFWAPGFHDFHITRDFSKVRSKTNQGRTTKTYFFVSSSIMLLYDRKSKGWEFFVQLQRIVVTSGEIPIHDFTFICQVRVRLAAKNEL